MAPTKMIEMNARVEIETKVEDGVSRFAVVPTGFETIKRDEKDEIRNIQGAKWRDLTASPTGDETYMRVTSAKAVVSPSFWVSRTTGLESVSESEWVVYDDTDFFSN